MIETGSEVVALHVCDVIPRSLEIDYFVVRIQGIWTQDRE